MTAQGGRATDRARPARSVRVSFVLNGRVEAVEVSTSTVAADLLRDHFGLRSVKLSCERAVCGACTSLVDGIPIASCSTFAFELDGTRVETVEGLGDDVELGAVQQAFMRRGAFQCGYCTTGMIMITTAMLRHRPDPDDTEIRAWLESNICRCTGYQMIMEAVRDAALSNGRAEEA